MKWYKEMFSNYAEKYESESFVQGTIGEVDFIEKEINFDKNSRILDIGCGTGRHALELAKKGYSVNGVDLSSAMIDKALKKAADEGLQIDFQQRDALNISYQNEYDLVYMICEGAFPLMETDEMNFQILKNASQALKKNGKLIFTTLNGLYPLFHSLENFIHSNSSIQNNNHNRFDLMTLRDKYQLEIEDDDDNKIILNCNERYYVPSEITWLLKSLGFNEIGIYGCQLGAFSRNDQLTTEDYEMLVIAEY